MISKTTSLALPDLIAAAQEIASDVKSSFSALSPAQVNWKPAPDSWSVGQCLDHLIVSNRSYYPIVDEVVSGRKETSLWQQMPLLPGLFGRMLIKALDPATTRKIKAPAVFQPAASDVDPRIVDLFLDSQRQTIEKMKSTRGLDLAQIIITSPAASIVTYSLLDAFRIIIVHERRHILQAKRVTTTTGFPAS